MDKAGSPKSKLPSHDQVARGKRLRAFLVPLIKQRYRTAEAFAQKAGIQKAALTSWWKKGTISVDSVDATALALGIPHANIHAILAGRAIRDDAVPPSAKVVLKTSDPAVLRPRSPEHQELQNVVRYMSGELTEQQAQEITASLYAMLHKNRTTMEHH